MKRLLFFHSRAVVALLAVVGFASASADEVPSVCRDCGRELPQDARFCPACGASVSAESPAPAPRPTPTAPGSAAQATSAHPSGSAVGGTSPQPAPGPVATPAEMPCHACGGKGTAACRNCKGFGRILCPNRAFHDYSGGKEAKGDGKRDATPSLAGPTRVRGGSNVRIEDTVIRRPEESRTNAQKCPICVGAPDAPTAAPCPECNGTRTVPCRKCGGSGKAKGRRNG